MALGGGLGDGGTSEGGAINTAASNAGGMAEEDAVQGAVDGPAEGEAEGTVVGAVLGVSVDVVDDAVDGPAEGEAEGTVEEGEVEGDGAMEGKADNKSVLAFDGVDVEQVESIAKSVEEEKRPDALADEPACAKASSTLPNVNVYICTILRCLCFISLSFPVVFPLTFPFFPLSLTRFTFWPKTVTTIFPPQKKKFQGILESTFLVTSPSQLRTM
jgi:hypothetical protein